MSPNMCGFQIEEFDQIKVALTYNAHDDPAIACNEKKRPVVNCAAVEKDIFAWSGSYRPGF